MLTLLALAAGLAGGADPCDDPQTPQVMERCVLADLARADSLLAAREATLGARLATAAARTHWRAANRDWRAYREHECRVQASAQADAAMGRVSYAACKLALAESRREFLEINLPAPDPAQDPAQGS
jgi:uncharacterized protein YecT (DUF1311 family)